MINKKIILSIFFLATVILGCYFLSFKSYVVLNTRNDDSFGWKLPFQFSFFESVSQLAFSSIRSLRNIPEGFPVRLKIPIIKVDSIIEDAFITPDGKMDVPAGSKNVAWFAFGPKPGLVGSAIIAGHYGIYNDNRGPSVFYNLDKLKVGDKVYIENDKGDTVTFIVRSIELFDRKAEAKNVFISNDGLDHLNLITCEGVWNKVDDNYPNRRVVFTDMIDKEDVAVIQVPVVATTIKQPARVGSKNVDVKSKLPSAGKTTPESDISLSKILFDFIKNFLFFH